jgi:hypothetical protein
VANISLVYPGNPKCLNYSGLVVVASEDSPMRVLLLRPTSRRRVGIAVAGFAALWASVTAPVACAPRTDMPSLVIRLSSEAESSSDSVRVKVEVKNQSKLRLDWDRDFSLFLHWEVRYADGSPVAVVPCDELPRPDSQDLSTRLLTLGPGQSVSRVFDLVRPMKFFRCGHSSEGMPTAYEDWSRFAIERGKAGQIMARIEYCFGGDGLDGVRMFYQPDIKNLHFVSGRVTSNLLSIHVE